MSLREWFTAAELAAFKLVGLPGTERNIRAFADRENWTRQEREGRGGGFEYHRISLPKAARDALDIALVDELLAANTNAPRAIVADRTSADLPAEGTGRTLVPSAPVDPRRESLWRIFERKTTKQKDEAKRRLEMLRVIEALIADGRPKVKAIDTVAAARGVDAATLRRWRASVRGLDRSDWLAALAPGHVGKVELKPIDVECWDFFKGDYLRNSQTTAEGAYERTQRFAEPRQVLLPSLKTLMRRLVREVGPAAIAYKREGAEALRRMYPDQQRDHGSLKALECVVADGHKLDVRVILPNGTVDRVALLAWQDVYSGKLLSWRLGETETAELVRLSFADLVDDYGIPDHALLDNGRAFAAKTITGGAETRNRFRIKPEDPQGVLTTLDVKVHWATPYHGQAKPIERAFRDLADRIARHPAFEGAYTGNTTLSKPDNYGSRAIPMAEVERVVAEEIRAHNARLGRESRVAAGRSFDQAFDESFREAFIRQATPEQKRMLLLAAEGVRSSKEDGSIRLYGNTYWSDHAATLRVRGQRLVVRFDPQRLDQDIHVYALDGRYLASMQCRELAGFLDVGKAREMTRARKDWNRAVRDQAAAEVRLTAADVNRLLPTTAAEPEIGEPQIVRPLWPKRTRKPSGDTLPASEVETRFLTFVDAERDKRKEALP